MLNIQGRWKGELTYGKMYRKHAGAKLQFEMDLVQNGSAISGTAIDISGVGVNEFGATIQGQLNGNAIEFVKQYTFTHHYQTGGKTKLDKNRKGSEIVYTGIYNQAKQQFEGSWKIISKYKILGFIPYNFVSSGSWVMSRKKWDE
jgi:hypothetical protein